MKLYMIIVDGDHAGDVQQLLDRCNLAGYSEIPTVLGKGETGRKLGTRAFPGSSSMFLAAVDGECATRLADELRHLQRQRGREEGLKAYSLDAKEIL